MHKNSSSTIHRFQAFAIFVFILCLSTTIYGQEFRLENWFREVDNIDELVRRYENSSYQNISHTHLEINEIISLLLEKFKNKDEFRTLGFYSENIDVHTQLEIATIQAKYFSIAGLPNVIGDEVSIQGLPDEFIFSSSNNSYQFCLPALEHFVFVNKTTNYVFNLMIVDMKSIQSDNCNDRMQFNGKKYIFSSLKENNDFFFISEELRLDFKNENKTVEVKRVIGENEKLNSNDNQSGLLFWECTERIDGKIARYILINQDGVVEYLNP